MKVQSPNELLETVDMVKAAVLVVDMQNDYCHEDGCLAKGNNDVSLSQKMVPTLKNFLTETRRYQMPIIHIRTIHSKWTDSPSWRLRLKTWNADINKFLRPGSWGAEFYKIIPETDEYIVTKHRFSAFIDTDLDLVLRSQGIRTTILTGEATNVCVQATAWDGYMKDYYTVILGDCTAAFSAEEHEAALSSMERLIGITTTSETIIEAWRIGKKG